MRSQPTNITDKQTEGGTNGRIDVILVSQCSTAVLTLTVVRATSQSYEDSQIWGCMSELQNPWTSWQKFDVNDYVGDINPHAKIQNDRNIGGVCTYGKNITLAWFVVFLLCDPKFCCVQKLIHRTDFYTVWFITIIYIPRRMKMHKFVFQSWKWLVL